MLRSMFLLSSEITKSVCTNRVRDAQIFVMWWKVGREFKCALDKADSWRKDIHALGPV